MNVSNCVAKALNLLKFPRQVAIDFLQSSLNRIHRFSSHR